MGSGLGKKCLRGWSLCHFLPPFSHFSISRLALLCFLLIKEGKFKDAGLAVFFLQVFAIKDKKLIIHL
jgi:hypothetical protein